MSRIFWDLHLYQGSEEVYLILEIGGFNFDGLFLILDRLSVVPDLISGDSSLVPPVRLEWLKLENPI